MSPIITGVMITGILFLVFIVFIFLVVRRRKRIFFYYACMALFMAGIAGAWTGYKLLKKSYHKVREVLGPRSGIQIYTAIFEEPGSSCLQVINQKDQTVPRLDCCIFLECYTCPEEMKRIVARHPYEVKTLMLSDTTAFRLSYGPQPEWWKPTTLGDNMKMLLFTESSNRELTLFLNKDSTHMFYCDMAD